MHATKLPWKDRRDTKPTALRPPDAKTRSVHGDFGCRHPITKTGTLPTWKHCALQRLKGTHFAVSA